MNPSVKFNYLRKPFKKFTHRKVSKKSKIADEIQEVGVDNSDTRFEGFSGEPSLTELKGELETAVSQYLNQVKELGFYKEGSSRDAPCQFTTFKTPALPRKTIKQSVTPDERLLDVKFQLNPDLKTDSGTYEDCSLKNQGLDNPLYLSLSECATGTLVRNKEAFYENISVENSDEDHIYENVEHHLYDTVSNPPRPRLPPKPDHLSNASKGSIGNKIKKKSFSFSSQTKHEKLLKDIKDKKPIKLPAKVQKEEKTLILDGSETSDLGSSGSEDTTSEEDWPLPPFPVDAEVASVDIPLPPPPPEIALQQLEDEVFRVEDEKRKTLERSKTQEKSETRKESLENPSQNHYDDIQVPPIYAKLKTPKNKAPLEPKKSNEPDLNIGETDLQLLRAESFSKKHLKKKIFTLNKGLHAYKNAAKDKDTPSNQSKSVDGDEQAVQNLDTPAVRHSVVIELKDSTSDLPSSHQAETQIKEKLETIKSKPLIVPEIKASKEDSINSELNGSVSVNIKQEKQAKSKSSKNSVETFHDQVIEISEDGSWEMKETKNNSEMESVANSSPDVDPFTGMPILSSHTSLDSSVQLKEIVKEYVEPDAYFDDKPKAVNGVNGVKSSEEGNVDGVYTAACVSTNASSSVLTDSTDITETKSEMQVTSSSSNVVQEEVVVSKSIDCIKAKLEEKAGSKHPLENGKPEQNGTKEELNTVDMQNMEDEDSKAQSNNIGAAIMEGYERDLRRKKENLNLPEVSLLEFGDGVKDLEIQRKSVIEQMTVKAKKKDSWIRTFRSNGEVNKDSSKTEKDNVKSLPGFSDTKTMFENKNEIKTTKPQKDSDESKQKSPTEIKIIKPTLDSPIEKTTPQKVPEKISLTEAKINEINEQTDITTKQVVQQKNEINSTKNAGRFLGKCVANFVPKNIPNDEKESKKEIEKGTEEATPKLGDVPDMQKGELNSGVKKIPVSRSSLESEMIPVEDDSGWEPVANVKFKSDLEEQNNNDDESSGPVPPPPEFSADSSPAPCEDLTSPAEFIDPCHPAVARKVKGVKNERPARQYVYGADEVEVTVPKTGLRATPLTSISHENIIEAEIREQQLREEAQKKETQIRNRDKTGGATSPSSHTSDEGFVDPPLEEAPSTHLTSEGFTHTLKGADGEPVIYDAVCPPSEYFADKSLPSPGVISSASETKIALEIRELKEREAELRALRELREREQQLSSLSHQKREEEEEEEEEGGDVGEEVERESSSSSRGILEDNLTSITTTTDEGNFSECGDPASSEDKSSDGSNSRMMSPDLHSSFGSQVEPRPRRVTVKPFEDDEAEQVPVYTQMKKESVIEREIRLAKEREEAFRREKGLITPKAPKVLATTPPQPTPQPKVVATTPSQPQSEVERESKAVLEAPKRGVQHRLATNRIQLEIEETSQREKELRKAGKIITLSEDTVDSKVTRLSDLASDQDSSSTHQRACSSISSSPSSSFSSLTSSPTRTTPTPLGKRNSSPISSPHTPSSTTRLSTSTLSTSALSTSTLSTSTRLTRSLSTTNLSMAGSYNGGLRAPQKGLMQKFIASRGKMTGNAFGGAICPTSTLSGGKPPAVVGNGIVTRPMRVSPKTAPAVRRDLQAPPSAPKGGSAPPAAEEETKVYRRTHATAEEKIQAELKEMKKRETELRRLRARTLARSQPNLAGLDDEASEGSDAEDEAEGGAEGVDSSSFLPEVNGLRTALSNPNLLDDDAQHSTQSSQSERGIRRRSALIAQWEGRIQQTTET